MLNLLSFDKPRVWLFKQQLCFYSATIQTVYNVCWVFESINISSWVIHCSPHHITKLVLLSWVSTCLYSRSSHKFILIRCKNFILTYPALALQTSAWQTKWPLKCSEENGCEFLRPIFSSSDSVTFLARMHYQDAAMKRHMLLCKQGI